MKLLFFNILFIIRKKNAYFRLTKWLNNQEIELKKEIIRHRADKFELKKISNQELNDKIFNSNGVFAEEAEKVGLIDEVATVD